MTTLLRKNLDSHGIHFYIIYQGSVRLYRFVDNEKHILDICDEGDLFGLRPLIMNENYVMGASANEETILYGIPIALFHDIILNYPKVRPTYFLLDNLDASECI